MAIDPVLDPTSVDWRTTRRASYLIQQSFRYEYPDPIWDLNHRLVVIPPARFGDQRRLRHQLSIEPQGATFEDRTDRFGNTIVDIFAARVPSAIEFSAEITVERHADEPNRIPDGWLSEAYLLEPSPLTAADDRIRATAEQLGAQGPWGLELADRLNDWVYQSMTYRHGVTGVKTTAAEALALGAGVCQDYAHVMLALCRVCGLPSRYVSGHLLGQGGTHAWVEVLLPANDGTGDAIASTFDPTHASRGGLGYLTIAVGGDYSDVAPTSGTYRSSTRGTLTTRKRVTLTDLE
jgi:transglutaminase-like putative cysteine protease